MQSSAEGLTISVPAAAPDPVSSTIVLQVKGRWKSNSPACAGLRRLGRFARQRGPPARRARSNTKPATSATTSVSGPIPPIGPTGSSRSPGPAGSRSRPKSPRSKAPRSGFRRRQQRANGAAPATGDYGKFKVAKLGVLEIAAPGKVTLAVRPVKDGWHPLNLKAIRLKPVAAAQ